MKRSIKEAWHSYWENYFNIHGRATRSEYWVVELCIWALVFLETLGALYGFELKDSVHGFEWLFGGIIVILVTEVALVVGRVTLGVRRYRSAGMPDWTYWVVFAVRFIPYVKIFGSIANIVIALLPGKGSHGDDGSHTGAGDAEHRTDGNDDKAGMADKLSHAKQIIRQRFHKKG